MTKQPLSTPSCRDIAEASVMTLLCDRCGDVTALEASFVVLEAQVIAFVDAHSAHEGHEVRVSVRR